MSETFGAYAIDTLIGQGGMAVVHRATVTRGAHQGRVVALKRLRPELAKDPAAVELFLGEARVASHLKHPTIVDVLDVGVQRGVHYIAMDFVEGRDLAQIIRRCAERNIFLPKDFALYVIHVVAQALDVAHKATDKHGEPLHIVHCDVTPSNVFVSTLGEIRLGDFGVAKTGKEHVSADRFAGKVNYAAPEQILGEPLSAATDVFALGAVLYELLTNVKAFFGTEPEDIFPRIVEGVLTPPSQLRRELGPELDALVTKALAPRRAGTPEVGLARFFRRPRPERFIDARALCEAVEPLYDPTIGTPLAIAAVVRGLFA